MYCRQCGKELPDGAQFCPYCGAASNAENAGGQNAARQNGSDNGYAAPPYPPYPPRPYPNPQDIYSGGWIALGFFFPLVGLIKRACPSAQPLDRFSQQNVKNI